MEKLKLKWVAGIFIWLLHGLTPACAQQASNAEELAKKLANPVASLVSVPFQNNTDFGIGEGNGTRNTLNLQPVLPIALSPKLTLITRTILPFTSQMNITGTGTSQTGLGDISFSAFFAPASKKIIWAIGPILSIPTATNNLLGSQKLGIGPTAIVLKQGKSLTFGALISQLWSVAGSSDRSSINQMFIQPFISNRWPSGASVALNAEINENWHNSTASAFIIPSVSAVTKLGKQAASLSLGPRIPVAASSGSMADFGVRASLTLVFPK